MSKAKRRIPRKLKVKVKAYAKRHFLDPQAMVELRIFEGWDIFTQLNGKDRDRWKVLEMWTVMVMRKAATSAAFSIKEFGESMQQLGRKASDVAITIPESDSMINSLSSSPT